MYKESLQPYVWMILGSFCFAWMAASAHALRLHCDWQVIALARSTTPLVLGALLTLLAGARLVLLAPPTLWVRSIGGSISLVCTFFALTVLPPSHVFTLASTYPLWVALLSWPLYRERPSRQVWLSVAGSILGIVLIELSVPQPETTLTTEAYPRWIAIVCMMVAALATAVAMHGLHRLRHIHTWAIVAHFSGVAVLFSLASLFLGSHSDTMPTMPKMETLLLLLAVGLTATVGQLFLTKAYTAGPPAKIAVVDLMQVVFAAMIDAAFWDHHFNVLMLGGMALTMAPTAWLMASPQKKN